MSGFKRTAGRVMPPVAVFLLLIAAWQSFTSARNIPRYLLPGPLDIFTASLANAAKLSQATGVTAAGGNLRIPDERRFRNAYRHHFFAIPADSPQFFSLRDLSANGSHRGDRPLDCALVRNRFPQRRDRFVHYQPLSRCDERDGRSDGDRPRFDRPVSIARRFALANADQTAAPKPQSLRS